MQMSREALERLCELEDVKLESYRDIAGNWTIGVGHIEGVKAGMKITLEQAKKLLLKDIKPYEACVEEQDIKHVLNQRQFEALTMFCFNVGVTAFKNSTLCKCLKVGNLEAIPAQLMRWVHIKKHGKSIESKGLVNRRKAEIEWFNRA